MPKVDNNGRSLLLALGIGDYNATGIIPYLFMAPAQTDSDMAATVLMVEGIQKALNSMGARLPVSGDLDVATVVELKKVVGPDWLPMKWYEIVRRVVRAKNHGFRLVPGTTPAAQQVVQPYNDDGMGMSIDSTSAKVAIAGAAGLVLWLLFGKKRPAARKGR
jgi:hypothetical protein